MFCYNCGKELPDGSVFCSYCGTKISAGSFNAKSGFKKSAEGIGFAMYFQACSKSIRRKKLMNCLYAERH